MAKPCFHCGEACPADSIIQVERQGTWLPFCCHGCKAVSELIFASGLDRYYDFRTSDARKVDEDFEQIEALWTSCDQRQDLWGDAAGDGKRDLLLQTEGVECAACAWLIRSRLEPRKGVERVQVDVSTGYTRILWNPTQISLSAIALELVRIGYRPHLPIAGAEQKERLKERRNAMLRVGVAGLGMMQVMMYAVGLYAGEALGISAGAQRFLEWTSLLVTIPVVLFSARPFFTSAIASLRAARLNMDVPVSLAILVAFIASCFNFLRGSGEVYFDSVVMFVFFLSSARYIQISQRHRNLEGSAALARLLPEWSHRYCEGDWKTVLASDLEAGDRVRVRSGETVPADGVIISGSSRLNEALLTGEYMPCARGPGDAVVGGSINVSDPIEIRITAVGQETTVSALGRMLMKAGAERSRFVTASERVAGYFVAAVLLVALLTAGTWYFIDPSKILSSTLAVLVVSCPCALSLAAPAAVAAAGRSLLNKGVMMTSGVALEALGEVKVAVFDKTGTLTIGSPEIVSFTQNPDSNVHEKAYLMQMAASLEAHSAHPLAKAFRSPLNLLELESIEAVGNGGVSAGFDDGRWSIGSSEFTGVKSGDFEDAFTSVWLTHNGDWVAHFGIEDAIRPGASGVLSHLREKGIATVIASGDREEPVAAVAQKLGFEEWHSAQQPQMKIDRVHCWQQKDHAVLMVGDGVNDAPVLAAADVSMTVAGASDLANSTADFVLGDESLDSLSHVFEIAAATRKIIRQNFTWAIIYNATALPLAVSGVLEPWMAALGMSLSSLLVVANAARLCRHGQLAQTAPVIPREAAA